MAGQSAGGATVLAGGQSVNGGAAPPGFEMIGAPTGTTLSPAGWPAGADAQSAEIGVGAPFTPQFVLLHGDSSGRAWVLAAK